MTLLSRSGLEARKIIKVTGHKNPNSIIHYCDDPTIEEKQSVSSILHEVSGGKKSIPAAQGSEYPFVSSDVSDEFSEQQSKRMKSMNRTMNEVSGGKKSIPAAQGSEYPLVSSDISVEFSQQQSNSMNSINRHMNLFTGAVINNPTFNIYMSNQ